MAKAEQLMVQLGIQRAELEAVGQVGKEEIVEVRRLWKGNYSIVMIPFVQRVANGFGGLMVFQSVSNTVRRYTYVVGPKSQVEEFHTLIDSLHTQVMAALKAYQRETVEERRYMTDMEKYVQHRSFIDGFGVEVGRRLRKIRVAEEVNATPGAALVLASREADIQEWVKQQYGPLGKSRGGSMSYGYSGAVAGQRAGKSATLNQRGLNQTVAIR
jgi:hypothetical protein